MNEQSDESDRIEHIPEFFQKKKKTMEKESEHSDKMDKINENPEGKKEP